MKTMPVNELGRYKIERISAVEKNVYGEFEVTVVIDGERFQVIYEEWSRCSNKYVRTRFGEQGAENLLRKYGKENQKPVYTFIHDPRLWEEPYDDDGW